MLHKEDLDECGLTMSNVGWVWIHMKVLKYCSRQTFMENLCPYGMSTFFIRRRQVMMMIIWYRQWFVSVSAHVFRWGIWTSKIDNYRKQQCPWNSSLTGALLCYRTLLSHGDGSRFLGSVVVYGSSSSSSSLPLTPLHLIITSVIKQ